MNLASFRERLCAMLGRVDTRSETIALAAEVIAADARFNLAIAEMKREGKHIDLLELSDFYEPLVESCLRGSSSL